MTLNIEDPAHILDSAAAALEEKSQTPVGREHTFSVDIQSGGESYRGSFTNRILTIGERSLVNAAALRFNNGLPLESLPAADRELLVAVAHMTESLRSKRAGTEKRKFNGPDWAENLFNLEDEEIIFALWEEVMGHENRYFRRGE